MVVLGILAVLQILVLPGFTLLSFLKIETKPVLFLSVTIGSSLIINYLVVLILVMFGLYSRTMITLFIVVELIIIYIKKRSILQQPLWILLNTTCQSISNAVKPLFKSNNSDAPQQNDLVRRLVMLLSFILAVISITHLSLKFISNIGTVFNGWDSVHSWNPWSLSWSSGNIPIANHLGFYPQLIPINWSLTYLLTGNNQIQFFAKSIMPIFPLLVLLLMFEQGIEHKNPGYFFSVFFTYLLFNHFLGEEISNGYVDLALAFFAYLSLIFPLNFPVKSLDSTYIRFFVAGSFFAAGAAITKQAGAILLVFYPIIFYILAGKKQPNSLKKTILRAALIWAVVSLVLAAPWYVYRTIEIIRGANSGINGIAEHSMRVSGQNSIIKHIFTQMKTVGFYNIFYLLLIPALFLLENRYRFLIILIILPFTALWAYFASYDYRNLAITLPFLGLVTGFFFEILAELGIKLLTLLQFQKWKTASVIFFGILLIPGLIFTFPESKLLSRQINEQKQIFDPEKNALLYELIPDFGSDVKVLTNYPVAKLPGFENNQVSFSFDSYEVFLDVIQEDENIELVFIPSYGQREIFDYLEQGIELGTVKLIFESDTWISYTMFQIIR